MKRQKIYKWASRIIAGLFGAAVAILSRDLNELGLMFMSYAVGMVAAFFIEREVRTEHGKS